MPSNTKQVVTWFEIPTTQLDRAAAFYSKVLQTELKHEVFGGTPHAMFVAQAPMTSGAIVQDPNLAPVGKGTRLYFLVPDSVDAALERAVASGGKVVMPATPIGEPGIIGVIEDLDGNHIGLHTHK